VKPQFRVLSGLNKGRVFVFSKPEILAGRHPEADVRFDAQHELAVSARHAMIFKKGDKWYVRDNASRNGTLVNGHLITTETKLDDTDQIRFGNDGPAIEFRLVPDSTPDTVPLPVSDETPLRPSLAAGVLPTPSSGTASARPASAPPKPAGGAARPIGGSTTQRIRVEVMRQTRSLRSVIGALLGLLLVVTGWFLYDGYTQRQARARDAAAMQALLDSILQSAEAAVQSLKGQVAGLATALRQSQSEIERLRTDLAAAQAAGDDAQVADLRRRLDSTTQALRNQQVAAQVDYPGLWDRHQDAVALVYVEFGAGQVFTGTAFAVSPQGVMITNKHVVAGADGTRRATRIGVKFADSDQTYPARVLALSSEADVAVVKVDVRGGTPTIGELDARGTVKPGDPVAIIGFPLGVDLPMDQRGGRTVARTTLTAGTVSKVLADRLQVDGYGAEGSSGSPILSRDGRVIGVLFGGQPGTEGRIVFGVPASYAARIAAPYLN
jgi:S1-C subfamily serine protease